MSEEFRLVLPCHPGNQHWKNIQSLLGSQLPQSIDEFVKFLGLLNLSSNENIENENEHFQTLVKFLSQDYKKTDTFLKDTLPRLALEALRLPDLFPDGFINQLQPAQEQVLRFSKEQIACIIIHMFFGTIQKNQHLQFWTSYHVWYSTNSRPTYLHVLFEYLERVATDAIDKNETVTFVRKVLTLDDKLENNVPLIPVTFRNQGEITDCHGSLEVDFANKDVTFGRGGTQEEILLGMSPELHLFALIGITLQDNESFVVNGAEKIGMHSGFGADVKYEGPFHYDHNKCSKDRFIVAIDAMNYDEDVDYNQYVFLEESQVKWIQFNKQYPTYQRELRKAYCGFSPAPSIFPNFPSSVATGGWGTGAFGGHPELKWMAASMAGMKELIYFPFGNEEFANEFAMFVTKCLEHSWTVAKMEEFLASLVPIASSKTKSKPPSIFSHGVAML